MSSLPFPDLSGALYLWAMRVTLTWYEIAMAAEVGMRRQLEALKKGLVDQYGYDGTGWSIHIEGAGGELATAKVLGLYWGGSVNTFHREGDVGEIQVRTRSREDYDLLIRENDHDADRFVLVVGRIPHFDVVGWIRAKEAKREAWKRDYGRRAFAYFVPHSALSSIATLRHLEVGDDHQKVRV